MPATVSVFLKAIPCGFAAVGKAGGNPGNSGRPRVCAALPRDTGNPSHKKAALPLFCIYSICTDSGSNTREHSSPTW